MKKFILLLFLLNITMALEAQVRLGIRAGLSTFDLDNEQIVFSGNEGTPLGLALQEANYNFHGGLFLRFGEKIFVQPEVIFNTSQYTYELESFGNISTYPDLLEERYNHLDIPLQVGAQIGPLQFNIGPVAHILLDQTTELENIEGFTEDFKNLTLGWQGGGGLKLGRVLLEVRYESNFSRFGNHINVGGESLEFTDRPSRVIFSIGYFL